MLQPHQPPKVVSNNIEECDQIDMGSKEDGSTESEHKDPVRVERLVSLGQIFPGYDEWIAAGKPLHAPTLSPEMTELPTPEPKEREMPREQE